MEVEWKRKEKGKVGKNKSQDIMTCITIAVL